VRGKTREKKKKEKKKEEAENAETQQTRYANRYYVQKFQKSALLTRSIKGRLIIFIGFATVLYII